MAISFIERAFGPTKLSNGGSNASVCCPNCGEQDKKKLVIHTQTWLCHCWVCGFKSKTIYGLLAKHKPYLVEEFLTQMNGAALVSEAEDNAFKSQQEACLDLPRNFQLLAPWLGKLDEAPYYIRQAVGYLRGRGLTEREFWYFKLGITVSDTSYMNRIIVPSHDADGNLNFFTGRSFKPGTRQKYLNPGAHREGIVFNELNVDWSEPLTLVEGPFDLMKVNDNATCLLGKDLTKDYVLFQKITQHKTPTTVCLDSDAVRAGLKIAKLLYEYDVPVKVLELPPGVKDPGECSRDQFEDLLAKNTVEFDEIYYLRNLIK